MLGMDVKPLRIDEIQIVLRAHSFYKLVQNDWLKRLKESQRYLEATEDNKGNLNTGGECHIFDIIEELKIAFKDDKEV